MKVIGITGGVGAGKSTVLELLSDICKCCVIKADDVAKKLMMPGEEGYENVLDIFGDDILAPDKTIDRTVLADIIFKNPNKRMVLNSIIHPMTKRAVIDEINNHKIAGDVDFLFVEAALLFDDHYDIFMDETWYINASEDIRRERLVKNRGYSNEKITGIFKSQLKDEEFKNKCDRIIDNSKDLDYVKAQLEDMLKM